MQNILMTMTAIVILVQIDYGEGLKAVGSIACEVTELLNALLSDNEIISVDIEHIRFRTTFQNIGFFHWFDTELKCCSAFSSPSIPYK